jgi:hypothetical protein
MSLRFGETLKNLAEITGIAFFQSKKLKFLGCSIFTLWCFQFGMQL